MSEVHVFAPQKFGPKQSPKPNQTRTRPQDAAEKKQHPKPIYLLSTRLWSRMTRLGSLPAPNGL